jgi:hypothetical protein
MVATRTEIIVCLSSVIMTLLSKHWEAKRMKALSDHSERNGSVRLTVCDT